MNNWIRLSVLLAAAAVIPACGGNHGSGTPGVSYKQIERLGRPAVNEGLVVTNDYLNAFNEIPPSAHLRPSAAPVVTGAAPTLTPVRNNRPRGTDLTSALP